MPRAGTEGCVLGCQEMEKVEVCRGGEEGREKENDPAGKSEGRGGLFPVGNGI
jgi:hypothetical protein